MAALPRTIHDLEEQFAALAEHIPDTPEKQAISVLHGIMMEMWRNLRDGDGEPPYDGFPDIAELYRSAPPMEAAAINEPLAPGTPRPRSRCAIPQATSCGSRTSAARRS